MASVKTIQEAIDSVPGFLCFTDVITEEQEKEIMDRIKSLATDSKVFKQSETPAFSGIVCYEFGYQFREKLDTRVAHTKGATYQVREDEKLDPFPDWVNELYDQMVAKHPECKIDPKPEHCIISDYPPGKGCAHHLDHLGAFGELVVVVVLGSGSNYELRNMFTQEVVKFYIPARTLYVLKSNARYDWTHSVVPGDVDILPDGAKMKREQRMIVTYRSLGEELTRPPE